MECDSVQRFSGQLLMSTPFVTKPLLGDHDRPGIPVGVINNLKGGISHLPSCETPEGERAIGKDLCCFHIALRRYQIDPPAHPARPNVAADRHSGIGGNWSGVNYWC